MKYVKLSYWDKIKLIEKMTQSEVYEVLDEARFLRMSTEDWLRSHYSEDLRRRVMERG